MTVSLVPLLIAALAILGLAFLPASPNQVVAVALTVLLMIAYQFVLLSNALVASITAAIRMRK